ncbi:MULTISPECIES: hypothetical protein [Enterobacteriaceae]|uniref:Uncharacterized protein n=1 Tax=Citrobacter werkmanii TaxID=67827 RepID=A0A9N8GRL1_9ENTR|nr:MULTISPECIES: hypothetical protein [Enterobacteriaceae]ANZ85724.1 hypothetical protein CfB38_0795 [Citrobacter freundii]EJF23833.1 hypothetical protein WYG_1487 [Citrobacter sp. A1]EJO6493969.1 hypothetical protein [Citrobacter freundii]EKL0720951.1 hypothetical protein [Citrobacter freundii]EKT8688341.1 hypothetical protein [Citrobacter freundii]
MEIILKSKGVHLHLDNSTAEQLLNLSAVARLLEVSPTHLRQLLHRGMSVSDALHYLTSKESK